MAWEHKNLDELLAEIGVSVRSLSENTGIIKLGSYFSKNMYPSMNVLIQIADYLAVPLDFIADRCDRETAENVLKDYGKHFMELRRGPYEAYLIGRRKGTIWDHTNSPKWESPWPYNLADDVYQEPVTWLLTSDHEEGIKVALSTLTPKEQHTITWYYEYGESLDYIGNKIGVTRERVRQIIVKGLRKLRTPSRIQYVLYGKSVAEERDVCRKMREDTRLTKRALTIEECILEERERALAMRGAVIDKKELDFIPDISHITLDDL